MIDTLCTILVLVSVVAQLVAAQGSGSENLTQIPCQDVIISMGAAIGALVVLELVTVMGWVCTAIMQYNTLKPKPSMAAGEVPTQSNQSYEDPSQLTAVPPIPDYGIVQSSNTTNTIIPNYDTVELKSRGENPQPVGVATPEVKDDQFYNAETHMYASVDKKGRPQ